MPRPFLALCLIVPTALFAAGAARSAAQPQPAREPIDELLLEVRELRLAIERLASAAPRTQLLTSRLTIQEERANRAGRELDAVRSEIDNVQTELQALRLQAKYIEEAMSRQADPRLQEEFERQKEMLDSRMQALALRDRTLRVREAEAVNSLAREEASWDELSDRLNQLERSLDRKESR